MTQHADANVKVTWYQRWYAIYRLTRLDKPVGIWLLLWPTLWGLLVAGEGYPSIKITIVFVVGTILMRSAGCVFNDIADRHWDGAVARTQYRPLVTGELSVKQAYLVAFSLLLMAFVLVCQLDWLVVIWSIPALFLTISYPYTKRFFAVPQAYLGLAFGFGIPMAFVAIQGHTPATAWYLLFATFCWAIAYDTEYAMVDRDDDAKIGIRSSALTFGRYDVAMIMGCFCLMMLTWAWLGVTLGLAWPFWGGWGIAIVQIVLQFQRIRARQTQACFKAFLHNVWIGASLTIGLVLSYWL